MVKVVVQHHVADYDVWYPVFTEHEAARRKHGATGHALLRSKDDPDTLVIVTEFASADGGAGVHGRPDAPRGDVPRWRGLAARGLAL